MSWLLFALLTCLCLVMLARGLLVPGHFYHFPFFAAGIFLTFIVPQMPGIINNPFIEDTAINKTLFFAILCLAMCWIGWSLGVHRRGMRDIALSEQRLLRAAAAMSLVGAYFFYSFSQLPDEERLRGLLTGTAVAYLFFAKLLTYGFAVALLCFAQRPSWLAVAIVLFGAAFYFERIIIAGKRGETAEFLLLIALTLWFRHGWAVPRTVVLAGLLVSMVGMLVADEYRAATYYAEKQDWSAVQNIDIEANWNHLLQEGGPEMTNAVMLIDNIDRHKQFDFGASHWNYVVFNFVPAQIVGRSVKDALMFELPALFQRGYEPSIGSTWTGLADAFASFWYFGAVKFLVLGWLMGWIYAAAIRGNTIMQIVYILSAVPSMLAVTHFMDEVTIAWIHLATFLGPALFYARIRVRGSAGVQPAHAA